MRTLKEILENYETNCIDGDICMKENSLER